MLRQLMLVFVLFFSYIATGFCETEQSFLIAGTLSGKLLKSSDGINWQPAGDSVHCDDGSGLGCYRYAIAWGNGQYVVLPDAYGVHWPGKYASISTDGINWKHETLTFSPEYKDAYYYLDHVDFINGYFYLTTTIDSYRPLFHKTVLYKSTDGKTWSLVIDKNMYGVAYGKGVYVGADGWCGTNSANRYPRWAGCSSEAFISADTKEWLSIGKFPYNFYDVVFVNNQFIGKVQAMDELNGQGDDKSAELKIATSQDGKTWVLSKPILHGGSEYWMGYQLDWGNGRYVMIRSFGAFRKTVVYTSSDALNWTRQAVIPGMSKLKFFKGLFVAVGEKGIIMTSPDGKTWTQRQSGVPASDWFYALG